MCVHCASVCVQCVCVCVVPVCFYILYFLFKVQGLTIFIMQMYRWRNRDKRIPLSKNQGFFIWTFLFAQIYSLICFYVHGSRGCSRGTDGSGQHKAGKQHRVWRGETSCCIADWCVTCYTFLKNASWIVPCPELHMLTPVWLDQSVFKYLSWTPNYLKKVSEAAYISEVSM